MLRGDQARVYFQPTPLNGVVMETLAELRASQLPYFQPASLDAVLPLHALHHDYAVSNALQLQVMPFSGAIIQQSTVQLRPEKYRFKPRIWRR